MPKKTHPPAPTRKPDFHDPAYFIDRELSWLAFNDRVIEEAEDLSTPLLERLRFLGIASSNLDEFFMVRVSGIQEQLEADVRVRNPAGFTPEEHFARVHERAHVQVDRMFRCFTTMVLPAMEREGIHVRRFQSLSRSQKEFVRAYFDREVFPVLTPLAVDSGHPFPHLRNLSLNVAVRLQQPGRRRNQETLFAVVQVPTVLDRIVRLPSREDQCEFVLLEEIICQEIQLLFAGMKVIEVCGFRLTRDADIEFAEEEADDLLKTVEQELRRRERGSAVRLGVEDRASNELVALLRSTVGVSEVQVYRQGGPMNLAEVAQIAGLVDRPELKFPPFTPTVREPLRSAENIFDAIARRDILLHHPYESFSTIIDFIEKAAKDPDVLAIKQTMYRTSGDSKIIKALMAAAANGKQVAALMEVKARFDEERNITWAREMERAGVHVVYGLVGLKTHSKICLVVRKEKGGLRRYVHLSTGNYNPITARVYTDLGLLTCDPDLCDDAGELFNLLTGYSYNPHWLKMVVAPIEMRKFFLDMIDAEIDRARAGTGGRIRAKMNSVVDTEIIGKLYEASRAGVQIDLLIRGICCLRPGIPGVSENIRVSSIVDRFLEHSRIMIFGQGEDESVYLSSADWMPRNLDRRVETVFPIEAPDLKERTVREVWDSSIGDNVKRRILQADGSYIRAARKDGEPTLRAQEAFMEVELELRSKITTPDPLAAAQITVHAADAPAPLRPAKPAARNYRPHRNGGGNRLSNLFISAVSPAQAEATAEKPGDESKH